MRRLLRGGRVVDPDTPVDGSEEVAIATGETGAAMHHCHVTSTAARHVDRVLAALESSRSAGSRVTVEAYPYGAGCTAAGAFFLDPSRVVLLETGERIADEARLRHVRAEMPGAPCLLESLDEQDPGERPLLHRPVAFPTRSLRATRCRRTGPTAPARAPDGRFRRVGRPTRARRGRSRNRFG
ncbi:hypothetical protein BB31_06750 [Amycolatopsis lurida NRRL 2430]|uniref:Uncharacterized protein n=1 Tax=Amycolatopsis lurida NRRL 2430 TaxID=1460371 RepID=A0A2P2FZ81_AMYLU|nr:hypothetical protein BB31_06750 [Amycolatopsis lurida NRRL 2430]